MSGEPVRYDVDDRVLTLTLDRAEQRNALNPQVNRGLLDGLARARGDDQVVAVVLTGAGDRAFCAGGDLAGMRTEAGALGRHHDRALFADVLREVRGLGKPVVARVNGAALGGGLGLALACHLVVAADHATFGTPEVKVGMWPHLITTVLVDHLGPKHALELMLTGRRLSAEEARGLGLVNQVVPADALDVAVDAVLEALLSLSPAVLALGLESWATAADMRRDEALAYLGGMLSLHLETDDVAEGIAAFLEKRRPRWRGR